MTRHLLLTLCLLAATAQPAAAGLKVFACEPEWGALATELGGEDVTVDVATTAHQDVHHIQARPSLIAKVRRADLVVCTGAELEIAWLPLLLRQSANSKVQPGGPGYFTAANYVPMLEIPERLDRAEGDIHPYGNPHIHTNPHNIALVAEALAQRLEELDPSHAEAYRSRYTDFTRRWQAAIARWEAQAAPLRGAAIVTHHKGWPYLIDWLGLVEVTSLESKPGIPPSSAHLAQVLSTLEHQPARMVIRAAYQDGRPSAWLAEHAHIPAVELPFTVGGTDGANDLFGLFDVTLARLLDALS